MPPIDPALILAVPEPVCVTAAMLRHALRHDLSPASIDSSDLESIACEINGMIKHEYGPPPVIKTATGEEEGGDWVLWWDGIWTPIRRENLDPGDRYVELPKCCGEGEA